MAIFSDLGQKAVPGRVQWSLQVFECQFQDVCSQVSLLSSRCLKDESQLFRLLCYEICVERNESGPVNRMHLDFFFIKLVISFSTFLSLVKQEG